MIQVCLCEGCHCPYATPEEAEECEKKHLKPKDNMYQLEPLMKYKRGMRFPHTVYLEFPVLNEESGKYDDDVFIEYTIKGEALPTDHRFLMEFLFDREQTKDSIDRYLATMETVEEQ